MNEKNVSFLPETFQIPKYNRNTLSPGLVHLGCGAFHRTHLMDFHEDTLEHQRGDWGVIGVNLRSPDIDSIFNPQGGLYCRQLRHGNECQTRLIGGLLKTISVLNTNEKIRRQTIQKALQVTSSKNIKVITMTVTEKGYCHAPSTGMLQENHPDVAHDIIHPNLPRSVPGFVLEVIKRCIKLNHKAPAFISCDNVPRNGQTLKDCVLKLAEQVCPNLLQFIDDEVIFLSTMVDRIVPATRKQDIVQFQSMTNLIDSGLVVGEPYRMWVIEKDERAHLPDWSASGAIITTNVHDYELIKMRVVNGMQTALAHLGHLSNFIYMSDVFSNEIYREFGRTLITKEVLPNLPKNTSIKLNDYVDETVDRLINPAIGHRTAQISSDGSQKIRHRLIDPLHEAIKTGLPYYGLTIALSAWIYHIFKLSKDKDQKEISDPFLKTTIKIRNKSKNDLAIFIDKLLEEHIIFPVWINEIPNLKKEVYLIAKEIQNNQIQRILKNYLSQSKKYYLV
ncbi:MAG: hypothetical protein CMO97_01465 [Woeseia sp.]|nr:hypothetical protein [Woeseia sp.]